MIKRTQYLLHDIARLAASRMPHRIALSHNDRTVTFAELQDSVEHVAAVLAGRGVRRGERVAVWADTCVEMVSLYYGIASIGAIFVPINPRYTDGEAAAVIDMTEPAAVVGNGVRSCDLTIASLMATPRPTSVEIDEVDEWDADVIFFTSGTTGRPKGVVLSHRSNRMRTGSVNDGPVGPMLNMFPLFHWGGWSGLHQTLHNCDEVVLVDDTQPDTLLAAIERRKVVKFYAIPAVWKRVLEADRSRYDLSSLREARTGTSATPPELRRAIQDAFPGTITTVGYGATEAGRLCALPFEDLYRKPYSVGLPAADKEFRIVDGELWVRSPHAFLGYYQDEQATSAAVVDGWYRTGDLVERDEEGYVWVIGRVKDMIRSGGEYVAPAEVDVVIQRHPSVADGATAGIPHDDWGEVVAAFVVLRPGATLTIDELRSHCQSELAPHKCPRELHLVDAIERTGATGQVQRRRLVDIAAGAVSG